MSAFMHELMEMALTHDTIVMTVLLVFVILGVMLLTATLRRTKTEPERVLSFDLKSCDICYRSPYHGEKLDGWRCAEGFCVCADCSPDFP